MGAASAMSKKDTSKKTTWEKLNNATNQDAAKSATTEESVITPDKSQNKLTHPTYEALETQLLETETQLENYKSQLVKYKEQEKYQLAEVENIRRRTKLDVENAYKFSLEKFIKELLPVKDSLETALELTIAKENSSASGIQLTLKQLQNLLEKNGVKSIEPAGEHFDAHFHEAMLAEENDALAPNTIIKVLQKGYLLHERLIRPALVVVAKAKENAS